MNNSPKELIIKATKESQILAVNLTREKQGFYRNPIIEDHIPFKVIEKWISRNTIEIPELTRQMLLLQAYKQEGQKAQYILEYFAYIKAVYAIMENPRYSLNKFNVDFISNNITSFVFNTGKTILGMKQYHERDRIESRIAVDSSFMMTDRRIILNRSRLPTSAVQSLIDRWQKSQSDKAEDKLKISDLVNIDGIEASRLTHDTKGIIEGFADGELLNFFFSPRLTSYTKVKKQIEQIVRYKVLNNQGSSL